MRIVVTGAAGFVGSNLVQGLNARGIDDIVAVGEAHPAQSQRNLEDLRFMHLVDAASFYARFEQGAFGKVDAVLHQGACTDTMETDERSMMAANYGASCRLFEACRARSIRLLYASSAAVYGDATACVESPEFERPLNAYARSKLLFDQHLRHELGQDFARGANQVVGLRYFNVYGPREQHKGGMASVAFHQYGEYLRDRRVRLFGEYGGYGPGEQERDFVFVDDVVAVVLWFLDHPARRGLFNVGTGRAQPFNDVALAIVNAMRAHAGAGSLRLAQAVAGGSIGYIPFPDALRGKYQCHTEADLGRLRGAGCDLAFADVASGVARYVDSLVGRHALVGQGR